MSYPIEYGLDKVNDLYEIQRVQGGQLKSRGCYSQPESLWDLDTRLVFESQGAVITRWLGKNKLS